MSPRIHLPGRPTRLLQNRRAFLERLEDRSMLALAFAAASDFAVSGDDPFAVATGDFNGDGQLDLAAASPYSNSLSVLLNTGTGHFGVPMALTGGAFTYSVATGDFNGDGKLDLAAANTTSNNVSVWFGTGTGAFGTPLYYPVGTWPRSVTTGDFNGDGKLDLATANETTSNVSVLLNNGSGGYGAALHFAVGNSPYSVTKGDFNGDGKLDLATANLTSDNVSVLLGNGAGNFAAATNFNVGTRPRSVTVGDFNGDGKLDLAAANFGSTDVSVLLGTGAGSFAAAVGFTVGSNPSSVTVGDFDGDGKLDLAAANSNSNNVSVLLGTGAGSFATATNFNVGSHPLAVTTGDLNGDGRLDLATANGSSFNVSVLINTTLYVSPHDYGDAPDRYATLRATNGPQHLATGPLLGAARDVEDDGQPSTGATGDDLGGAPDDEDGVVLATLLPGLASVVQVTASAAAKLDAWLDFNGDGAFGASEQVFASQAVTAGVNTLNLVTPAGATAGATFARFRLSTAGGLAPTGLAPDGEVEDYAVTIASSSAGTARLAGDPSLPGGTALWIVGASHSDAITVKPATGGNVSVHINPFGTPSLFPAAAFGRIIVQAQAGNDSIAIDSRLTYPTLLYGDAGNDTISGGSGPDVIYGGEGTDSLAGNAGDDQLFGEAGADRLYGGAGFDTFTESGAGAFVLSASQLTIAGVSHTLSGLERAVLQGSAGGDSFHVGAWPGTGMIDGLGGTDKLLAAGDVNFTLTNSQLTRSVGGAFALASLEEAELTGGLGNNTLDASGFSGRLKLDGGSGNDVLKSGAGPALLLGGAGNDLLQGGAGRTVQIGGLGADTLRGGSDDDLLIGGTTSYDTNAAALLAILNEWASSASYADRVAHLKGALAGGLNGAYRLTSTTVRSDTHVDTLTGGGGRDWFFAKLANPYADVLTDRTLDETVN